MKKKLTRFIIAGTVIAALFVAGSAMAAVTTGEIKAKVNIKGGELSLVAPGGETSLTDVLLDGSDQLGVAPATSVIGTSKTPAETLSDGN